MPERFIKRIFPLLATLLLVPWPIAYAHTYTNDITGHNAVRIEVAEPSAAPSWSAFGKATGGVTTPTDLFYIDATGNTADIQTILYLVNAQELSYCYRYLILKVKVYVKNDIGAWQEASMSNGGLIPDTFITLHNGQVSFTLPGYAEYKVTINRGSFYCITTNTDRGSLSPEFYLEAG